MEFIISSGPSVDRPTMRLPSVGSVVAVEGADGRFVPTSVAAVQDKIISVALPPALRDGDILHIVWSDRDGACRARTSVVATEGARCLQIRVEWVEELDRRGSPRTPPPIPLMLDGKLERADGEIVPVRGAVKDLSVTGLGFFTDDEVEAGDSVRFRLSEIGGREIGGEIAATVVRVYQDVVAARTCGCRFDQPIETFAAIGELLQ